MNHRRRFAALATAFAVSLGASIAPAAIDNPVVPNAPPQAKALLQYLDAVSGKYILSGQQEATSVPQWVTYDRDNEDVNFIQQNTGKLPVVRGFDLIWYTWRADIALTQTVDKRAEQWAKQGGVVQVAVHWFTDIGSPSTGPEFYLPAANNGKGTTFDISQVSIEGTPENKEFLEKLARFAPALQYLRDRNVPVIWRPFHECGGLWFWWSAKGAEPFKKAWRYLYDRMTNTYGLTNLIWCYNPVDTAGVLETWYPGDDVVDIISADVYPSSGHPSFAAVYKRYRDFKSGRKVVLLSENGAIPDPDLLFTEGAGWSSFCTWNGFISDPKANALDFVKRVYADTRVLTLDEVPDAYRWNSGVPLARPIVTQNPSAVSAAQGANVTLTVAATGADVYQWQHDGTPISGATGATFTLTNAQSSDSGTYVCIITNAAGAVSTPGAVVNIYDPAAVEAVRLINISTRSYVGTSASVQIAGFVIRGTGRKTVLIRASGPALAQFGLGNLLADPKLELYSGQTVITSNDNWSANAVDANTVENTAKTVGAFGWTRGSKDAALVATLEPGNYTAKVSGADGGSGVALVEVYEADGVTPSRLINISTRSEVRSGAEVQIAGFVVSGSAPRRLLIRASGPALIPLGVTGTLADPQLELFDVAQKSLGTNNDWSADAAKALEIEAARASAGGFNWSTGSKDAAMVVTLSPGNYTAIVSSANGGTGIALVEVYELP
jgi:hypothetical protein